jgi:hypothetical protein
MYIIIKSVTNNSSIFFYLKSVASKPKFHIKIFSIPSVYILFFNTWMKGIKINILDFSRTKHDRIVRDIDSSVNIQGVFCSFFVLHYADYSRVMNIQT